MPSPTTLTIGSLDYNVYADMGFVNGYAEAAISAGAALWRGMPDDDSKSRLIVSATRFIDRQVWQGDRVDDDQALAFPRTGLKDLDGNDVPTDDGLADLFMDGFCELVLSLTESADIQNQATTESNVASLTAGSVSITFWRGVSSAVAGRFSQSVNEILGRWLAGASGTVSPRATGVDGVSSFDACNDWSIARGL